MNHIRSFASLLFSVQCCSETRMKTRITFLLFHGTDPTVSLFLQPSLTIWIEVSRTELSNGEQEQQGLLQKHWNWEGLEPSQPLHNSQCCQVAFYNLNYGHLFSVCWILFTPVSCKFLFLTVPLAASLTFPALHTLPSPLFPLFVLSVPHFHFSPSHSVPLISILYERSQELNCSLSFLLCLI